MNGWKYKGVIFDFNGTLLWDNDFHIRAWNTISLELRGRPFTPEEFDLNIYGMTNDYIVKYLFQKPVDNKTIEDTAAKKEDIYRSLCLSNPDKFKIAEGAAGLLDFLKKCRIKIAIATASEYKNIEFYNKYLGLGKWFEPGNIIYNDNSFNGKPAPDIYLKAAEKLGLLSSVCVVFEDSIAGLKSAQRAGIGKIIAVIHDPDQLKTIRGTVAGIDSFVSDFRTIDPEKLLL